ncbi:MAG: hypothetical protein H6866_03915 [Rhodospirillales bacterium]|nr:MAG: hypothetical protein H6866_03915 [Rhodospirillales bacterium]
MSLAGCGSALIVGERFIMIGIYDGSLNDFEIQALVDNELGWEDEKRVRALLSADRGAKARYEMLRQQKRLLQDWWKNKKGN